ncbi:hypothetical protein AB0K35_12175 [Micromonospora sp. NPDC053740]|uniref:hypothetical protein n=1 Tax=Micromonospora sp. NPDC053740 TaxID=3155173 RepID=UPI0034479EEF
MRTWPERKVNVLTGVMLDPLNVRLGLTGETPPSLIINDLFANAKVLDLVQAITQLGFLTHEVPIVVRRGKDLVVVEGNRRFAALKAIQNPILVPAYASGVKKYVDAMDAADRDSLLKVSVKVAPSQEQADKLIAALHTSNPRLAWSPDRQAAFFEAQLNAGLSLDQLLELYPTVPVRDFVVRAEVLKLFKSVPYQDQRNAKAVHEGKSVKVSILERLYEYEGFQRLAGIEVIAKTASVRVTGSKRIFFAVAEKVVEDVIEGRLNTRTLNRQDGDFYQAYMRELHAFVDALPPSPEPTSDFTRSADADRQVELVDPGKGASPADGPSSRHAPTSRGALPASVNTSGIPAEELKATDQAPVEKDRPKRATKKLDVSGLEVPASMAVSAVPALLRELGQLNVDIFPNATYDLLRTVTEKTIKKYADVVGADITVELNTGKRVTLDKCLEWLQKRAASSTRDTNVAELIKKVKHGPLAEFPMTTQMNAINHNPLVLAEPFEVRAAWTSVKPILEWVLKA